MARSPVSVIAAALVLALGVAPARAQKAYIANLNESTVSVIDTATNTVVGTPIFVNVEPYGVAVAPDGSKVYVTNFETGSVSVIDTAIGQSTPITVGTGPQGVAVTPDGGKVYVANLSLSNVSVIATASNAVSGP